MYNQAAVDFMSTVVAVGAMRDGITHLNREQIIALFPVYYAEMLNGDLVIDSVLGGFNPFKEIKKGLDSAKDHIKKGLESTLSHTVNLIQNPLDELVSIGTKPLEIMGADMDDKIKEKILAVPLIKKTGKIVTLPTAALAITTAITGGATLPLLMKSITVDAARAALLQHQSDQNIKKLDMAVVAAESGQTFTLAPIPLEGDLTKLKTLISSPEYYAESKKVALELLGKMGYDVNNQATILMADSAARANIDDAIARINQKKTNSLVLPLAAAGAYVFMG